MADWIGPTIAASVVTFLILGATAVYKLCTPALDPVHIYVSSDADSHADSRSRSRSHSRSSRKGRSSRSRGRSKM